MKEAISRSLRYEIFITNFLNTCLILTLEVFVLRKKSMGAEDRAP